MTKVPVENSSNILELEWRETDPSEKTGRLSITFRDTVYDYDDFPAHLWESLKGVAERGESVGRWFHQHIRGQWEGQKRIPDQPVGQSL